MSQRFVIIRQGQEVERVSGVKYYAAELVLLTFFDENDNPIAKVDKVDMEIGDVVQPLAVGFIPFHPSINLNLRSPNFEKSMSKRQVSIGNNRGKGSAIDNVSEFASDCGRMKLK
jgi:hypothetical protein